MRQRIRVMAIPSRSSAPERRSHSLVELSATSRIRSESLRSSAAWLSLCVARSVMHSASLANLISGCSSVLMGLNSGRAVGLGGSKPPSGRCAQNEIGEGLTAAAEMPTPARNDIPLLGKQLKDRLSLQVFYPWPHSNPPDGLSSIRHYSSKNPS